MLPADRESPSAHGDAPNRSEEWRSHAASGCSTSMLPPEPRPLAREAAQGTRVKLLISTAAHGTLSLAGGELASTMMGCEPELQAQDEWLAAFLEMPLEGAGQVG
jgi:hypothetical protein